MSSLDDGQALDGTEWPSLVADHRLRPLGPDKGRYSRNMLVPEVGELGQRRINAARVVLVGAGGLGSPVALYLAASGVGTLGIVDPDTVALSNLQRQVIHTVRSVGRMKVDSAREAITALNPGVQVRTRAVELDADNAVRILEGWDLVVDATDSVQARYVLNDATARLGVPLVHGAVQGTVGQVTVFDARRGPCYRCLQPESPGRGGEVEDEPVGVLGVAPGVIGVLQATEALKLIVGGGRPLIGQLLVIEAWQGRFRRIELRRRPGCPVCSRSGTRAQAD
ncbi:MAG: ThiF family adenylyltransferase [Actinomyces sp.]|uniref:HesA/MoeB/ThiF family protein n=1 Tax=Actinomyces sp. TaxID=29317 RepID=UPI0026DBDA17|nr:ThiF family adenylyltransferase [Actinomyces sp.]MDO4242291.1 ThiF family adenylyltransferase [Actinomyces sp.]